MTKWANLSNNLKICVVVYKENKAGRQVWMSRLVELLKDEMTWIEVSKNQDRLYDLGILDMKYRKVDKLHTCCFILGSEAVSFVKDIVENLEGYPLEVDKS